MKLPRLYPLKFIPQLKERVWGGNLLVERFGKEGSGTIGESWELSGVQDNVSVVANGVFEGHLLTELLELYGEELVGKSVYKRFGHEFPLLFKFIDAQQDLSVQLHPNDQVARERHDGFGKTEMWYVLQAEKDARLILGFNQEIDKGSYQSYLSTSRITEILHSESVSKGDAFYIAPGTVHAIGAGVLLAEIQQTSDITYRIYDWDRPGLDGKMRELHTDLALDVIDFKTANAKLQWKPMPNTAVPICESPYFVTESLQLNKNFKHNIGHMDSFIVYMCVEGDCSLTVASSEEKTTLKKGEVVLIPAVFDTIIIDTKGVTLLAVYVPSDL